jgi:8-oxo-dGTP pyrophosphatase MutT (NUDIX family)
MPLRIHRVTTLDLPVRPWSWPFAGERRAEIDAHFADKQREKPNIWNGRVLLGRNPEFAGERLRADYFETDFASFLAWRDWGFPDSSVFNGFGMGALRSVDGAFIMGEMAQHTANAGRIYFPSGTPDLDDIRNGAVDIEGSVAREVEEETGLTTADYRAGEHWDCVVSGAAIAMIRILDVGLTGEELRARIEANLARQSQPELAEIHLVRRVSDLTAAMPRFVTAFVESRFTG